jgi:predicted DNA-binding protein YlxM (UPF0122 family)
MKDTLYWKVIIMDKLSLLLNDIYDRFVNDEFLIEEYSKQEGRTPLDVIIEKESRMEILEALRLICNMLRGTDREIFIMYVIEGKTVEEIGYRFEVSHQAISKRLAKIRKNISRFIEKNGCKIPFFDNYSEGIKLVQEKEFEAGSPTGCGFPFEFLSKVNAGGYWGVTKGKPIYLSRTECKLQDYFIDSFHDNKTTCNYCGGRSKCAN